LKNLKNWEKFAKAYRWAKEVFYDLEKKEAAEGFRLDKEKTLIW